MKYSIPKAKNTIKLNIFEAELTEDSPAPKPVSFNSLAYFDGELPEWIRQPTSHFPGKLPEWMPQLKVYLIGKLSEYIPQLKAYFVVKLSEWTLLLAHHPFFHYHSWMMKCPKYLFDCCPLVKMVDDNSDILDRLTDLNQAKAFSYIILRRLAEFIAQLAASWLIIIWTISFMIFIWLSLSSIKQKTCRTTSIQKSSSTRWLLKCIWVSFLLLLPLSFAAFYTLDSELIPFLPQRITNGDLRIPFRTLWDLIFWKNKRNRDDLLNITDFLRFSSLYIELYSENKPLKICKTAAEKLCRATKISLCCWSVSIFIFIMYSIMALGLYVFIWLPLKTIFSKFHLANSKSKHLLSDKEDTEFTKKKERIPNLKPESESEYLLSGKGDTTFSKVEKKFNLKLESGDTSEVHNPNRKYRPPENAVKPRYVTRGVKACLDEEDF